MLDLLVTLIPGVCAVVAAVIQGKLTSGGNKEINGELASDGYKKSKGDAKKQLESLEEEAKNLTQEGDRIRTEQHEVVNSYRSQVTALMLLSLFYGVASIYLQLSYTDEVKMTILFFLAFAVAFRTALTKLEKISQSTGHLRRRLKELQRPVTTFKTNRGKRGNRLDRQIERLEEAIAHESMELSKSNDKQANESSVLLPLPACVVVCGRCILGLSLSQLVQLIVFIWSLASTHPTLLLSTILQGCLLMLNHSGKDCDQGCCPEEVNHEL